MREKCGLSESKDGMRVNEPAALGVHAPLVCRRLICVGFRRWKAWSLRPLLSFAAEEVLFVRHAKAAAAHQPGPGDALLFWGGLAPAGLEALALATRVSLVRLEDGFVRSVGLGSDLIRPSSLVLDASCPYFDPTHASDLERLLGSRSFSANDLQRAKAVRSFIVQHGLTKYNLEPRDAVRWPVGDGPVVLVPGQVEDDASIRLGCTSVKTNMALLQSVRQALPGAFIVYKPHPDVQSGNRVGRMAQADAYRWADHIETHASVVSCLDACDEVHTMTSLTGFDALLRGKKVVTYGQPFYAGWGLTHDRAGEGSTTAVALERRTRRLLLDELVAGTLLHYPIYWDWQRMDYTSCEVVLQHLLAQRSALESSAGLKALRSGWVRRQGRKLGVLMRAWTQTL